MTTPAPLDNIRWFKRKEKGRAVPVKAITSSAKNVQRGQMVGRVKFKSRTNPPQPSTINKMVETAKGRKDGFSSFICWIIPVEITAIKNPRPMPGILLSFGYFFFFAAAGAAGDFLALSCFQ